MLILLTNDDGIEAAGLTALRQELASLGRVVTVAPAAEMSASSHSLTIRDPVRILEQGRDLFAVTATPVDCVIMAVKMVLVEQRPDLVVSGINHGPNLGDDILYSGTVAAAREAALNGIPALAISALNPAKNSLVVGARWVRDLLPALHLDSLPPGTFFNLNLPHGKPIGYRFTRQGSKRISSAVEAKLDPRGRAYYWIREEKNPWPLEDDTDYAAVQSGYLSVTPLQRDQTDYRLLAKIRVSAEAETSVERKSELSQGSVK